MDFHKSTYLRIVLRFQMLSAKAEEFAVASAFPKSCCSATGGNENTGVIAVCG